MSGWEIKCFTHKASLWRTDMLSHHRKQTLPALSVSTQRCLITSPAFSPSGGLSISWPQAQVCQGERGCLLLLPAYLRHCHLWPSPPLPANWKGWVTEVEVVLHSLADMTSGWCSLGQSQGKYVMAVQPSADWAPFDGPHCCLPASHCCYVQWERKERGGTLTLIPPAQHSSYSRWLDDQVRSSWAVSPASLRLPPCTLCVSHCLNGYISHFWTPDEKQ